MSAKSLSFAVTGHNAELRRKLACRPLTSRQQQVLEFMREFFAENDQLPSTSVIAQHFGWRSRSSAQTDVEQLVRLRRLETNAMGNLRFVREP